MKAAVLCFLPMAMAFALLSTLATFAEKDNCLRQCGNMNVPFPFGLEESCAWNSSLVLNCSNSSDPPKLFLGVNIPISNISVENGTMIIEGERGFDCYDKSGQLLENSTLDYSFDLVEDYPYTFSNTRNKLTVLGCDTLAGLWDATGAVGSGCFSYCNENIYFNKSESACSGFGCCQTPIPKSLKNINISMSSLTNYTLVRDFSSCGSAFLVDGDSFNVADYKLPVPDDLHAKRYSKVVLDWVVQRDLTCEEAKLNRSSYACGANSRCDYFTEGQGYRCFCEPGYTGNPYNHSLSPGCQDIDECKDHQRYPCHGICKNKPGDYTCDCPFGKKGDGKVGCQISNPIIIAAVIVLAMLCIIVSGLVLFICKRRARERYFRQNGGEILKNQRVEIFTEAELAKATNNYDASNKLGEGGFASVYRGEIHGGILVAVKKPKDMKKDGSLSTHDGFLHEISIISQVNHKNLVKLLGICLETKVPFLVYEFIANGTLYRHIHDKTSTILQSWKDRLRIASEAALALEYLHSEAEPPIIHGDIKTSNILLDENCSTKVSDFGASVLISPGKNHIAEKVQGTLGYLDPEYLSTGELTMKSDVYSFGVVLVELFTGEMPTRHVKSGESIVQSFISATENRTLLHMINFEVSNEDEMRDIEAVGSLARRCLDYNGAKRPAMREVVEHLARINENLWADKRNDEEIQNLLEPRTSSLGTSVSETNKLNSTNLSVVDVDAATTSFSF